MVLNVDGVKRGETCLLRKNSRHLVWWKLINDIHQRYPLTEFSLKSMRRLSSHGMIDHTKGSSSSVAKSGVWPVQLSKMEGESGAAISSVCVL